MDLLTRIVAQGAEQTRHVQETLDVLARRNVNESGMWSRLVNKPDQFRPKDRDEELSQLPEWSWSLKQYLRVVSPSINALIEDVESNLEVP